MQETEVQSLGQGDSPGEGNGNSLQCSCWDNPTDNRSLEGYSPWGRKGLDMTERLSTSKPEIGNQQKAVVNAILSGEILNVLPQRLGTKWRRLLSSLIVNIVLVVLASSKGRKINKRVIYLGKEKGKLSLLANNIIIYIENPKKS